MSDDGPTVRVGGVDVRLGDGWEQIELPGAELVLAGPATRATAEGSLFRPSFIVSVADAGPDADVRALAAEAVTATRAAVVGARVLAYDLLTLPEGREGRRLLVTVQEDDLALVVRQWIAVHGTGVTTVTATTAVTDDLRWEELLDGLAAQVLAHAPLDHTGSAEARPTTAPVPVLDTHLHDDGLEDLAHVVPAQPWTSDGPTVLRGDLDLLVAAAGRGDVDRNVGGDVPRRLVDAGLVGADGRVTDDGRTVVALLTEPTGRLRVEAERGTTVRTLDVHVRSGRALSVATASPATLTGTAPGDGLLAAATTVHLDLVDAAAVPALVAAWVGIAPAWSLPTSPSTLPEETVAARAASADVPPPAGADAHLRHVWAQPWFLWTLRASDGTGLVAVHAGTAGQLAVTGTGTAGTVGLQPMPSARVWSTLVRVGRAIA